MSRDNNWLKFSKPCNGHALKGLVKNWWASDTSLKDNAMEASDATNSFVRNHAGVSDQVPIRPQFATRFLGMDYVAAKKENFQAHHPSVSGESLLTSGSGVWFKAS